MAIGWYSLNPNSPNIRILIQLHQAPSTTGEPSSQEVEGNHSLSNKKMKTRPDFKLKKLIVSWTTLCLPLIKKKKSPEISVSKLLDIQVTKNVKSSFIALLFNVLLKVSLHFQLLHMTKGKLHCASFANECTWRSKWHSMSLSTGRNHVNLDYLLWWKIF